MRSNLAKSKVTSLAIHAFEEEDRDVFDKVVTMFKTGLAELKESILVEMDYREFIGTEGNAIARDLVFIEYPPNSSFSSDVKWYEDCFKDVDESDDPEIKLPVLRHVRGATSKSV